MANQICCFTWKCGLIFTNSRLFIWRILTFLLTWIREGGGSVKSELINSQHDLYAGVFWAHQSWKATLNCFITQHKATDVTFEGACSRHAQCRKCSQELSPVNWMLIFPNVWFSTLCEEMCRTARGGKRWSCWLLTSSVVHILFRV